MNQADWFKSQGIGSIRDVLSLIEEQAPALRALCCPKRYSIPPGYPDPSDLIISAFTGAASAIKGIPAHEDITVASIRLTTSMLIRYQVPTFFVSGELAEALLETEAPEDMLFSEIQMPMPACLFLLPEEFTRRYFGHPASFITAAKVPTGYLAKSPIKINGVQAPDLQLLNPRDLFVTTMLLWENGLPMHYDSRAPADQTQVKELLAETVVRYAVFSAEQTTLAQDSWTASRLANLTVNILLALSAEPELLIREQMLKPAKKKGKTVVKSAAWKPNFIGQHFRIVYEDQNLPPGSHRSPHAHWRRGHWRNQHHGPGNALVKRIRINPVFVGLGMEDKNVSHL